MPDKQIKMYPLKSFQELLELRKKKLIGRIKHGLLDKRIIVFSSQQEENGFILTDAHTPRAQLLKPSAIAEDELRLIATNIIRTMYQIVDIEIVLTPFYTAEELV